MQFRFMLTGNSRNDTPQISQFSAHVYKYRCDSISLVYCTNPTGGNQCVCGAGCRPTLDAAVTSLAPAECHGLRRADRQTLASLCQHMAQSGMSRGAHLLTRTSGSLVHPPASCLFPIRRRKWPVLPAVAAVGCQVLDGANYQADVRRITWYTSAVLT